MKRSWMIVMTLLIAASGISTARSLSVSASGRAHEPAGKKVCKTVMKTMHGKKRRVKVCRATRAAPRPTATVAPSRFTAPAGLAFGPAGVLYVLDVGGSAAVRAVSRTGEILRSFGPHGSSQGQVKEPRALAFDSAGNLYITDGGNNRVQRFAPNGASLGMWGSFGRGPGQFDGPAGIAIGEDGTVYVADLWHDRIEKFSPDGAFRGEIATPSPTPGYGARPAGIALDPNGNLWVAENGADRLVELSPEGKQLAAVSGFDHPGPLAQDAQGNIYLISGIPSRLEKLSPSGTEIVRWSPMDPYVLHGVAVDSQGNIFLSEVSNATPGPPPAIVKISPTLQVLATWK